MKTGLKIRYLRMKNNLTLKELSKLLNISESSISLIENGKRKPSLEVVIKSADYFNVTTDFLLGVSDPTNIEAQSEKDISYILENIIDLLNNQNYILFNGKNVDNNTVVFLKNDINCILENMRIITK